MSEKTHFRQTVFTDLEIADTFKRRLVGLLNRTSLDGHSALLLVNCRSVHTFGMRFPIDIAFLDKYGIVLSLVENMGTFRSASHRQAAHTLESRAGRMRELSIGVGNKLDWDSEQSVVKMICSKSNQ